MGRELFLLKNSTLELTAISMNRIWRTRKSFRKPKLLITNNTYDVDFNIIVTDKNQLGVSELFMVSEKSLAQVPCSRLERLMMVICSTPHQALLLLHTNLQGKMLEKHFTNH